MGYSADMKAAIGATRHVLTTLGLDGFASKEHGEHVPDLDAPLVMVACSGGRDSLALSYVASKVCAMMGLRCGAIIIDHGLIAGSDTVAEHAAQTCTEFGMNPVITQRVQVGNTGAGTEADARFARYQALWHIAREHNCKVVLMAHTKDDQAETVMMGVLRTVGLDALLGMPQYNDRGGIIFARPLLELTREQTTQICKEQQIEWWDDPTNGEQADEGGLSTDLPLRSRIRVALLPYLNHFVHADMVEHLSRSSALAQRDYEYLQQQAQQLTEQLLVTGDSARAKWQQEGTVAVLDAKALEQEHPAMSMRVIVNMLHACNIPATSKQIEAIGQLLTNWHGQGDVWINQHTVVGRQGHPSLLVVVQQ